MADAERIFRLARAAVLGFAVPAARFAIASVRLGAAVALFAGGAPAAFAAAPPLPGAAPPQIALIDDQGRRLDLPEPPRRIVSLAPHATELLFAAGLGPQVVAVDPDSDEPHEARHLPKLGALPEPSLEGLLALAPDLVVVWAPALRPGFLERLADLGVPAYVSDPRSLDAVASSLARFASLATDSQARARGRAVAAAFRKRLEVLRDDWSGRSTVRVFVQVWANPLITLSDRDLVGDQLAHCGARNVAADLPGTAPMVDAERVLAAAPDLLLATDDPASAEAWRRFGLLAPDGPTRFAYLDARILQRPGPRVLDAVAALCALIDSARQPVPGRTLGEASSPSLRTRPDR